MEKPADTRYDIHDLLKARWSPRAFAARPVEEQKLMSLFEAARWSPSGGNSQPWAFVVVTSDDGEVRASLVETMSGHNREWATHAPVLVLSVALPNPRTGVLGRFSYYDVGQAVAHLSVQAGALGLYVHQMAGFDGDKARRVLELPDTCEPMTLIAIGYYGDYNDLPDTLRERELAARSRKPIAEFVYRGRWGRPMAQDRT